MYKSFAGNRDALCNTSKLLSLFKCAMRLLFIHHTTLQNTATDQRASSIAPLPGETLERQSAGPCGLSSSQSSRPSTFRKNALKGSILSDAKRKTMLTKWKVISRIHAKPNVQYAKRRGIPCLCTLSMHISMACLQPLAMPFTR